MLRKTGRSDLSTPYLPSVFLVCTALFRLFIRTSYCTTHMLTYVRFSCVIAPHISKTNSKYTRKLPDRLMCFRCRTVLSKTNLVVFRRSSRTSLHQKRMNTEMRTEAIKCRHLNLLLCVSIFAQTN